MRLGKSLFVIRWAEQKRPNNVLLIAPLTVLPTWQRELRLDGIQSHVIDYNPKSVFATSGPGSFTFPGPDGAGESRWWLINPARLRINSWLCDMEWDVVIADESTFMRTPTSAIGKLVANRFQHVPRRAALTGMPNPEGPLDFFNQMKFLYGQFLGKDNFYAFRNANFKQIGYDWYPKSKQDFINANQEPRDVLGQIKQAIQAKADILTRKQAGIGGTVVRSLRSVCLPNAVRAAYDRAERDFELPKAHGVTLTKYAVVVQTWLAKLSGGVAHPDYQHEAKISEVLELLKGELSREQVVVWARFNSELFRLSERLTEAKISNTVITGQLSRDQRQAALVSFQKGRSRILLAQPQCAKYGLDCSAADTAIYFSRWHEHEPNAQSQDRIIHPNKKGAVLLIDIVARDTVDEDVQTCLREKLVNVNTFRHRILEQMNERRQRKWGVAAVNVDGRKLP